MPIMTSTCVARQGIGEPPSRRCRRPVCRSCPCLHPTTTRPGSAFPAAERCRWRTARGQPSRCLVCRDRGFLATQNRAHPRAHYQDVDLSFSHPHPLAPSTTGRSTGSRTRTAPARVLRTPATADPHGRRQPAHGAPTAKGVAASDGAPLASTLSPQRRCPHRPTANRARWRTREHHRINRRLPDRSRRTRWADRQDRGALHRAPRGHVSLNVSSGRVGVSEIVQPIVDALGDAASPQPPTTRPSDRVYATLAAVLARAALFGLQWRCLWGVDDNAGS